MLSKISCIAYAHTVEKGLNQLKRDQAEREKLRAAAKRKRGEQDKGKVNDDGVEFANVVEGDMYDEVNGYSHDDKAQKIVYHRNDGMNGSMNGSMNLLYGYMAILSLIMIIVVGICCLLFGAGSVIAFSKYKTLLKRESSGSNTRNDHIL